MSKDDSGSFIEELSSEIEKARAELERLSDIEVWQRSAVWHIFWLNFRSIRFYILSTGTFCFAALNGIHGYQAGISQGTSTAIAIAALYAAVEFSIPISAHMATWSGTKSGSKYAIRILGTVTLLLGMLFSLLILQGKFSSSSDGIFLKSEVTKQATNAELSSMRQAVRRRNYLASLNLLPPAAIKSKILSLKQEKSCGRRGRSLCWKSTKGCTNATASKSLDFCRRYATLASNLASSIELGRLNKRIDRLKVDVTSSSTEGIVSESNDEVISLVTGLKKATIQLVKPSLLATIVAIIIHIMWSAHGMMVNSSVSSRMDEFLKRRELERFVESSRVGTNATHPPIVKPYTPKEYGDVIPQGSIGTGGHVTKFIMSHCVYDSSSKHSVKISTLHDKYIPWAATNSAPNIDISSFTKVIKDLGYTVTTANEVVGMSMTA